MMMCVCGGVRLPLNNTTCGSAAALCMLCALAVLVRHCHLRVGQWYYATVRACNPVGLCHNVTSDGILYDDSPPLVGNVFVGFGEHGQHQNFLPSS